MNRNTGMLNIKHTLFIGLLSNLSFFCMFGLSLYLSWRKVKIRTELYYITFPFSSHAFW